MPSSAASALWLPTGALDGVHGCQDATLAAGTHPREQGRDFLARLRIEFSERPTAGGSQSDETLTTVRVAYGSRNQPETRESTKQSG